MIILETQRLVLRHFLAEDLEPLYALYADPDVTRYIPDAPRSLEETRRELEWHLHGHPQHPELGLWATLLKPAGALIGRCGLLPWTLDGRDEVEVAYLIGKAYWGQGLGTEAAQAVMNYAFTNLRLPRLVSLIEPGNRGSAQVAEKIGMHFERVGRDEIGDYLLYSKEQRTPNDD